jgi:hypothetical protein
MACPAILAGSRFSATCEVQMHSSYYQIAANSFLLLSFQYQAWPDNIAKNEGL